MTGDHDMTAREALVGMVYKEKWAHTARGIHKHGGCEAKVWSKDYLGATIRDEYQCARNYATYIGRYRFCTQHAKMARARLREAGLE
jgi:hypothetical protein